MSEHENICIPGIHTMVSPENMAPKAKKLRDIYSIKKDAPIVMREFGFYTIDRWISEGHIKSEDDLTAICGYDESGAVRMGHLGWCEAAFMPYFDEVLIQDLGDKEIVQDYAGRHVLYFKGRRQGFMPEYVDSPVKDMKTWEDNCKWRLNPDAPGRIEGLQKTIDRAVAGAKEGLMVSSGLIGGYMYLRSLMGPEKIMYVLYDEPELVHDCMQTWFALSDRIIGELQKHVTLDEIFFAEDISYKGGPLISPDMIKEFIFPYYEQLLTNCKKRQLDKNRHMYIQLDTDGNCVPIIPLYQSIGFDVMSPFEVASDCDVVQIGKDFPTLVMSGGIDKRELALGKEAIDRMLDRIMPAMKARGGYIPTCDHGVPEEVSFEDYVYFRKQLLQYSK